MYEIKVKIHEESDLYNTFDPDAAQLSDEVVSYILRKYQEKEREEKHCIHIISDTPVDEDRVWKNIHAYTKHEEEIIGREQQNSTAKQIRLFIIGIAFIAFWMFAASRTENIGVEVLSIIGSFAVWEAANIWIVERPTMRMNRRRLKKLMETEIKFTVI